MHILRVGVVVTAGLTDSGCNKGGVLLSQVAIETLGPINLAVL